LGPLLEWLPYLIVTTTGRVSGQPRHVALEYRRHGSKIYVLSVWGKRPDWYQNLLANPVATLQLGRKLFSARAAPVDTPGEALRALVLFRRAAPLADLILASMSSANTIDARTLTEVAGEFTVMRFDLLPDAPTLPGIEVEQGWQKSLLLAGAVALVVWVAVRVLRR
jgi:deazaflavin-dependent oxidoreductase (nitroreductase family)